MSEAKWMIYGAYGYTGTLVAEAAMRCGHKPILAGRSASKLAAVADRFGLDRIVIGLDDVERLTEAVTGVDLVFHAAGPFIRTSVPMLRACLAAGVNYLDVTGEIPVFHNTSSYHEAAREREVALISGAGFAVIPTDCLSAYVADQVVEPIELEIAIASSGRSSPGTTKTMLEQLPDGGWVRRKGELVSYPLGRGTKQVRFSHGKATVLPIPWGDLQTAYETTGIPNITTYMAFPKSVIRLSRLFIPILRVLLSRDAVLRLAQVGVEMMVHGPDEELRRRGRSYVWARAAARGGDEAQAWLETVESYRFTASAVVRCVEAVFEHRPVGALTPAKAFGPDFVLSIDETRRFDEIAELA